MLRIRCHTAWPLLLTALIAGCESGTDPDVSQRFIAPLTGAAEVPAVTTTATGTASFELNRAETQLRFTLDVADIAEVSQAHIHIGPPDENGPVIAFLFGPASPPVSVTGTETLAEGAITATDLTARTNAGFDGTFPSFVAALEQGNTYVNVHTTANPAGEIRGQIAID